MSIIFQLFSAEDLKALDKTKLEILKQKVKAAFDPAKYADSTMNTTLDDLSLVETELRSKIIENLRQRADTVFRQLKSELEFPNDPIMPRDDLELSWPLYPQILRNTAFDSLALLQRHIFEMAISCDVTHFNSYIHLLSIKKFARGLFFDLANHLPSKDPDTEYSPFKPDSPLYKLYNLSP